MGLRSLATLLLVLTAAASGGCIFDNAGSAERLNDAVWGLNDEVRWGRLDLALGRVAPAYQADFAAKHHAWGRTIQIADTEYVNVALSPDRDAATAIVNVSWYGLDTMTLHTSVIRQRWVRAGGAYALRSEEVLEGDEALLRRPPRRDAGEDGAGEDGETEDAATAGSDAPAIDGELGRAAPGAVLRGACTAGPGRS